MQLRSQLSGIILHFTDGCATGTHDATTRGTKGTAVPFPFIEILYFWRRIAAVGATCGAWPWARRERLRQVRATDPSDAILLRPCPALLGGCRKSMFSLVALISRRETPMPSNATCTSINRAWNRPETGWYGSKIRRSIPKAKLWEHRNDNCEQNANWSTEAGLVLNQEKRLPYSICVYL